MESKTYNKQVILNVIKKGGLKVLNPIGFIIDEICDCLLLDKYVAATTATNLLFEESLKLALIFHDSHGKTLDDGVDFENMYKAEVEQNIDNVLSHNIEKAFNVGLIDDNGKNELHYLRKTFRNPFSHGSHNDAIKEAQTIIASTSIADVSNIQYKQVRVKDQPLLYYIEKQGFLKREALGYFLSVHNYVCSFDRKLQQLY